MGKTNKSGKTAKSGAAKPRQAFQISQEPVVHGKTEEVHKYEVTQEPVEHPEYEELGQLPKSYGVDTLFLVARDPHWLFCYWDVDWSRYPAAMMREGVCKFFIKLTSPGLAERFLEISPDAPNWYIPVERASADYVAEIGFFDTRGDWKKIVTSAEARTPSDALSEEETAAFATLPLHLTFQTLLDQIQASMLEGENLTEALSRIQGEGRKIILSQGSWTEEQRRILAAIFGSELLERMEMNSGEIEVIVRKALEERLQSESASELGAIRARMQELAGPGVSSLFSGVVYWAPTELASLFSAIGRWGPEVSSLFSAAGAWGPVSSVSSAFAGWSAPSSVSSAFAGWGPGISSLFSAFAQAPQLSSLFSAMGYWGAESGSLFSAVGASWSAQPFGVPREFFMHVNAEVIFYGGTHPDAKVWIDGEQIKLNADGSFRYHFRFPDGNYDIPILAVSPDGKEQRSATLNFRRATSRQGQVGSTGQPIELGIPMGGS